MPYQYRRDDTDYGTLAWDQDAARRAFTMTGYLYALSRHAGLGMSITLFAPTHGPKGMEQGQVKVSANRLQDGEAADEIAHAVSKLLRLNRFTLEAGGPGKILGRFGSDPMTGADMPSGHARLRMIDEMRSWWREAAPGQPLHSRTAVVLPETVHPVFDPRAT